MISSINQKIDLNPTNPGRGVHFSEKTEKTCKQKFISGVLSCLKFVKNTSLKLTPCLKNRFQQTESLKKNEQKAYDLIRKVMLVKVEQNDVDGIFRTPLSHTVQKGIVKKDVTYGYVKNLISKGKHNPAHILPQLLLKDLRCDKQKICVEDMLRMVKPANKEVRLREFMLTRMTFKNIKEQEKFERSMSIISEIYQQLKNKSCEGATPYSIAQSIAPLIFDPLLINNNKHIDKLSNANEFSKISVKACCNILDGWHEKNKEAEHPKLKEVDVYLSSNTLQTDNKFITSQSTSEKQRSNTILIENESLNKEENIPAGFMLAKINKPISARTGYADCLIFSLVQHAWQDFNADSDTNCLRVKQYRKGLLDDGYLNKPDGFGPDGFMHSNSAAAKSLINKINADLTKSHKKPLRVIFHEFSPAGDNQAYEYMDVYGADTDKGRVVHVHNTGQHFEALVPG